MTQAGEGPHVRPLPQVTPPGPELPVVIRRSKLPGLTEPFASPVEPAREPAPAEERTGEPVRSAVVLPGDRPAGPQPLGLASRAPELQRAIVRRGLEPGAPRAAAAEASRTPSSSAAVPRQAPVLRLTPAQPLVQREVVADAPSAPAAVPEATPSMPPPELPTSEAAVAAPPAEIDLAAVTDSVYDAIMRRLAFEREARGF